MTRHASHTLPLALGLLVAAACGDGGGGGNGKADPKTTRATLPIPASAGTLTLAAGLPATAVFPIDLDPAVELTAVTLDLAATLPSVTVGFPARGGTDAARAAAGSAQVSLRVASVANGDSVCETGTLYGPFEVPLDGGSRPTSISPGTVAATPGTVSLLQGGLLVACVQATYPVAAQARLGGLAVEYTEQPCAEAPGDFAGAWTGTYQCSYSCGESFGGETSFTIALEGKAATISDGGPGYTGHVCGDRLRFASASPYEREHGEMVLGASGTATRTSTYRSNSGPGCHGECTETLTRAGTGGGSGPGRCPLPVARGCVNLLNFGTSPVHILLAGQATSAATLVPARTPVGGSLEPGVAHTTVSPTTTGTQYPFQARSAEGVLLDSATCTAGNFSWTEISPEVVWQQTSDLSCIF